MTNIETHEKIADILRMGGKMADPWSQRDYIGYEIAHMFAREDRTFDLRAFLKTARLSK